ncbi:MAG: type II secretion system protein [Planctomycetota bacterium]|jgi:prepilin-type N-terminal cleavage/methylation domain-containing protein
MDLKQKKAGFTLVELLTVLAIMALLVGILVPSINTARNMAKKAKQKGQFAAIEMAILSFKQEDGDYPPSSESFDFDYFGAQKLAEALVGWDLMGFHPDSNWVPSGQLKTVGYYDPQELTLRKGPYLDVSTSNAFKLNQLYNVSDITAYGLAGNTYVLCDSFTKKKVPIGNQLFNVGTPILYYKAYLNRHEMSQGNAGNNRYESTDNQGLCVLVNSEDIPFDEKIFYSDDYKIIDQKILKSTGRSWPHRADSYILISAGPDGLYGTSDDITNF